MLCTSASASTGANATIIILIFGRLFTSKHGLKYWFIQNGPQQKYYEPNVVNATVHLPIFRELQQDERNQAPSHKYKRVQPQDDFHC